MSAGRAVALCVLAAACAGAPRPQVPAPEPDIWPVVQPLLLRQHPYRPVATPDPGLATVCAGGDVMLGNDLDTAWARGAQRLTGSATLLPDPDSLLVPLRPLVADADVVLLNVEGAVGSGPVPRKCRPGSSLCYAFRQVPEVAGALRRLAPHAAVVGNVANNHAMDAGVTGFDRTREELRGAGVAVSGDDTLPAFVPLAGGDTVAVLGFSVFSAGPDARDVEAVRRHVARAAARAGRVVVSLHMGAEGAGAQRTPDARERYAGEDRGNVVATARAAVDAGADLVIGHGPHVLRAAEWRGDALVAYSLGNLVTYGPFNRRPPLDRGGLLCAVLDRDGRVARAEFRATYQVAPGVAFPDPASVGARLVDSLSALDFPETGAVLEGETLLRPVRRVPTPARRVESRSGR